MVKRYYHVHHMTQKYRLATAIAVLKVKPTNLSIEEYIADLKNKMSDNNMEIHFLDISIGSDDFNLDDDVMINDDNDCKDNAEKEYLNDSVTILKDININVESNENAGHEAYSLENVMRLLKDVEGNVETASNTVVTDNITQRASQIQNIAGIGEINANYIDVEMQDIPFQNTQINETQDLTFVDSQTEAAAAVVKLNQDENDDFDKTKFGNYEFDSEIYSDNMIITESIEKNNSKQRTIAQSVLKNISKESKKGSLNKTDGDNVNNKLINTLDSVNQTIITDRNAIIDYDILIETQLVERNNDMANKVCQNLEKVNQNTINDSQSTVLYSWYDNTQNFTHVSQSQYDDLKVHDNFIHGSKKYTEEGRNTTETQFPSNTENIDAVTANNFDQYDLVDDPMSGNSNITHVAKIVDIASSEIQYIIDKNGRTYRVIEGLNEEDKNITTKNTNIDDSNNTAYNQNVSQEKPDPTGKISDIKDKTEEENQNFEITQDINDDNIFDDDLTVSQKEVIPFKVIEELNKIKTFLNRKTDRRANTDSNSMDSGYRSDSQSKSSFKSALQLTGNAINQSAHCVYTHLLQCPLVGSTQDITLEIATTLGRLVDKLHENETYPSFLEDILDTIDSLLKGISEGENFSDTIILTKDENIQRLLLLNKSSHLIQYSIDKITSILEKLHKHLTNEENLYEIVNIDITENMCYIFQILEILIKRYSKARKNDLSSQNSTQDSQESEGILKKSSITDMWRKKWNPDCKNVKTEGSLDKKCVLTRCGAVLNKVIVDCMEGYSLVSFAALQCFNLLQS